MKILLTHTPSELDEIYTADAINELRKLGEVCFNNRDRHLNSKELYELAPDAEIIISEWETGIDEDYIKAAKSLKAFIRCGVEIRNVDFRAADRAGIIIVNTPGLNTYATVEYTIGMMVCIGKKLIDYASALKSGRAVPRALTPELCGKTLSLIGVGFIGAKVAAAASALGMEVVGYDPYVSSVDNVVMVPLDEALVKADFLSLHARWSKETEKLIGKREIGMLKPCAYIINSSRGALIDEDALYEALSEGRIAGAALDVFATEPKIEGNKLIGLPNVLATPHIAGYSPEMVKRQAMATVSIVKDIKNGRVPDSSIDLKQMIFMQ